MTYSTGTVYKIVCSLDENIIYIGSTFNQPRHRWQQHKNNYKKYLDRKKNSYVSIFPYFEKIGIENFKIMKIKDYECYRGNKADSKHLHAYEQLWINKTRCVNKISAFSIPIDAKEKKSEHMKEYYQANREKRTEYNQANREKISEKKKENYQANREKILERERKKYQANREKKLEYNQANRKKISEYQKERLKCNICDKEFARGSLTRHKKRIHPT